MSNVGRHALRVQPLAPIRLAVTAAAVLIAVGAMIAAVVAATSAHTGAARPKGSPRTPVPTSGVSVARANAVPAVSGPRGLRGSGVQASLPAHRAAVSLVLTSADHHDCPATATACVDLTRHITWLQAQGKITFGPVQMEPGQPGGQHQTPRGTFQVQWKAGPTLISNIYHEAMPWATFFAAGGIAFHGGSLTSWSHGCVHLTVANAHYYNEHLPIGAQVVVF
jgi:L,D-transpeptidase catalytic domain